MEAAQARPRERVVDVVGGARGIAGEPRGAEHDGWTHYARLKGKKARLPGMRFGEGVMWKRRPQSGPLGKLFCFWSDGI